MSLEPGSREEARRGYHAGADPLREGEASPPEDAPDPASPEGNYRNDVRAARLYARVARSGDSGLPLEERLGGGACWRDPGCGLRSHGGECGDKLAPADGREGERRSQWRLEQPGDGSPAPGIPGALQQPDSPRTDASGGDRQAPSFQCLREDGGPLPGGGSEEGTFSRMGHYRRDHSGGGGGGGGRRTGGVDSLLLVSGGSLPLASEDAS